MSRVRPHYDPYYLSTSSVGKVRAGRSKYLGFDPRTRFNWDETERSDPSSNTVVEPANESEGAQLLLAYYEAVRFDRILWKLSLAVTLFGFSGMGFLFGWLFSNSVTTVFGVGLGIGIAYAILTGNLVLPGKTRAAKQAFHASEYFRDHSALNGYLITTRDKHVIWEAIGLEQHREAIDSAAVRLRTHLHLPEHREAELIQLDNQEQGLRRRIVDMLDPQRQDASGPNGSLVSPTDEVFTNTAAQRSAGDLR